MQPIKVFAAAQNPLNSGLPSPKFLKRGRMQITAVATTPFFVQVAYIFYGGDIVLLDYEMKGMSGKRCFGYLCRWLRKKNPKVKIIGVTNEYSSPVANKIKKAADGYMQVTGSKAEVERILEIHKGKKKYSKLK